MEINKSIRAKLFALFVIMGAIPFLLLVGITANSTYDDLDNYAKDAGRLKNYIISEHITELIEKNRIVLQSVALSPEVIQYIQEPTPQRREIVSKLLNNVNSIFDDTNCMALTGADAWQLIRTDDATLVNLSKRQHFKEAMKGKSYVTDIISSMSTGSMIIVVESPVFNAEGKPIGMVQRNFDLTALEDYIKILDDEETYIVLMDRSGHIIANSRKVVQNQPELVTDNNYKFILDRIYNSSGAIYLNVDGEKSLVAYSRNVNTGWTVISVRPYRQLMETVFDKSVKALIFGLVMLFFGVLAAYVATFQVTKPLIEMTNVVDDIISGKKGVEKIDISSNDELGQMAAAFNRIKSDRDTFRSEAEIDKLTGLFNKKTMEMLCKMKLKAFKESLKNNAETTSLIAFYIIDLDHFKEVNDLLGHQFGDKVLIEFSKGLKKIFRPNDYIGRFGGDEFVVIVDGLPNMEVVCRKATQINDIATNLAIDGKARIVTASVGISVAPKNGLDYDTLFAAADKAVYFVKNHGKNNYHCDLLDDKKDDDEDDDSKKEIEPT